MKTQLSREPLALLHLVRRFLPHDPFHGVPINKSGFLPLRRQPSRFLLLGLFPCLPFLSESRKQIFDVLAITIRGIVICAIVDQCVHQTTQAQLCGDEQRSPSISFAK